MVVDVKCGNVASSIACSCNCNCNSAIDDAEAGDFECNICFDLAQDPVVTLCGHLYCWPCLYQWLDVHYYSHECPVCKAIIEKEKLVPIFGRGRGSSKPRPQLTIEVSVPKRPVGQRPPTAPPASIPYFREAPEPTGSARIGNLTLSAFLRVLPAIFSLPGNGSYDANAYGSTTGIPYLFPSSFDGGYAHGFSNRSNHVAEKRCFMRMFFLFLGILALIHLLF